MWRRTAERDGDVIRQVPGRGVRGGLRILESFPGTGKAPSTQTGSSWKQTLGGAPPNQEGPEALPGTRASGTGNQGPDPLGQRALELGNDVQPGSRWVSLEVCPLTPALPSWGGGGHMVHLTHFQSRRGLSSPCIRHQHLWSTYYMLRAAMWHLLFSWAKHPEFPRPSLVVSTIIGVRSHRAPSDRHPLPTPWSHARYARHPTVHLPSPGPAPSTSQIGPKSPRCPLLTTTLPPP